MLIRGWKCNTIDQQFRQGSVILYKTWALWEKMCALVVIKYIPSTECGNAIIVSW